MGRFRYAGKNWEGRPFTVVPALITLGRQVEERWPTPHPLDGTVASRNHDRQNPRSDHRPWPYTGPGRVKALDVGETVEDDGFALAEGIRLSRDRRVRYVIHEGRLFSSYPSGQVPPFTWRPYSGHPHSGHVHVSVLGAYADDTRPWSISPEEPMPDYRNVVNVPDTDWAPDVIDWALAEGVIIAGADGDAHPDFDYDWDRGLTDGRYWTMEYRRRTGL